MSTTTSGQVPCPNPNAPCVAECTGRVDITFESAVFQIVQAVAAGSIVENARLIVEAAFDGSPLALNFGTSASPSLIMAPTDSDLSTVAEYVIPAGFLINPGDNLVLNLVLGGSTTGKATLLFDVRNP